MLAYAASRPRIGARRSSPNALLAVIALHVGLLAAVMSVKMDLPRHRPSPPLIIDTIRPPEPPPPNPSVTPQQPRQPTFTQPQPQLLLPRTDQDVFDPAPHPAIDPSPGPSVDPVPRIDPQPLPPRIGARLLTPASELKPPYPQLKLLAGEESVLRLRLAIDEQGRVVAVDPIGRADPAFLQAARRHLLAHWRYKPALEGGHAVASTEVITLRFQLDG